MVVMGGVRLLCSGVALQAVLSLNNPVPVWPDRHGTAFQLSHHAAFATSTGFRFRADLRLHLSLQAQIR